MNESELIVLKPNMNLQRIVTCGALFAALALGTGCSRSSPPQFKLNLENKHLSEITTEQRQEMVNALTALFGTPDDPYLFSEAAEVLNLDRIRLASGPFGGAADGSQAGLYRQHCVHCHGISGDGAGPTALFLNPYPRDYRAGTYKFKATMRPSMPTHEDLARVLREGVSGTAMPAFNLLSADEIDALVEYVKYLSVRGQTESLLWNAFEAGEDLTQEYLVSEMTSRVNLWASAKDEVLAPAPYPETLEQKIDLAAWKQDGLDNFYREAFALAEKKDPSAWAALGEAVFKGARAQCVKCHGPTGIGDGSADDPIYDEWNKPKADDLASRLAAIAKGDSPGEPKFFALPVQIVQPRNLRMNVYRGGRSPADLFRRIHQGINGVPMPASNNTLKTLEIWSVVDYVRNLPYEPISQHNRGNRATVLQRDRM